MPNNNFDTGAIARAGKYWLNDETQAKLLDVLAKQNFHGASQAVRAELLDYFGDPDVPYATKRNPKKWARLEAELAQLKKAHNIDTSTATGKMIFTVLGR